MNCVGTVVLYKKWGTDDFINILLANGYTVTITPVEDKLQIEICQEG